MKVAEIKTKFKNKLFALEFPNGEVNFRRKLKELEGIDFAKRLWGKDVSIWSEDKAVQASIQNRLGWLDAPVISKAAVPEIKEFAKETLREKFGYVVLLGMGGSSLAPDMFSKIFKRPKGFPKLIVLDSTDPSAVKGVLDLIELNRSLFIVSSKSGSTIETDSFYQYFYDLLGKKKGTKAGRHFVAITDPGSSLEKTAQEKGFRKIFLTPENVGGRYSALTYFGLVPAALMGIDVDKILDYALDAIEKTGSDVPIGENPAFLFGVALAEAAKIGKDKLTFVSPPLLEPFGDWVEQLVAESTGKAGKGILPVVGEPQVAASHYGADRFFVFTRLKGAAKNPTVKFQTDIAKQGFPFAEIALNNVYEIGALFFFWELVTAVAGICLSIDPFDEPNVSESKQATKEQLLNFSQKGKLKENPESCDMNKLPELKVRLKKVLGSINVGDYVTFMIFARPSERIKKVLGRARLGLIKSKKVAASIGFGPRFLHSTGQLHKGGPASGVFVQLTHLNPKDLAIPGKPYAFEILKQAQALGDFESLKNKGRRSIRVVINGSFESGLLKFTKVFLDSLGRS